MKKRKRKQKQPKLTYKHDWLPDDEEANKIGYYLPTPEELSQKVRELREARLQKKANGFSSEFEPDLSAFAPPLRRQPL